MTLIPLGGAMARSETAIVAPTPRAKGAKPEEMGTVIQTSAAVWVRARVASVYLLVIMGAMAAGGALWGVIAERLGIANSLWIASAAIFVGLLLTGRAQMQLGSEADFSTYMAEPENVSDILLEHDKGPVAVEIAYRINSRDEAEFIGIAHEVGLARKRNGALAWRLYRNLESPERLVERFLVNSWLDYLRQAERLTRNDQQMERRQRGAIDAAVGGVAGRRRGVAGGVGQCAMCPYLPKDIDLPFHPPDEL